MSKKKPKIFGLDPSLNNTAFCTSLRKAVYYGKFIDTSELKLDNIIERVDYILKDLLYLLKKDPKAKESNFFIEMTFSMMTKTSMDLNSLGAIIRWNLLKMGIKYYDVQPQELKSFIVGKAQTVKGNKKQLMLKEIYKKYDMDFYDDNEADAFGLMKFGECFFDIKKCINKHQEDCILRYKKKLESPPKKKRKKKNL